MLEARYSKRWIHSSATFWRVLWSWTEQEVFMSRLELGGVTNITWCDVHDGSCWLQRVSESHQLHTNKITILLFNSSHAETIYSFHIFGEKHNQPNMNFLSADVPDPTDFPPPSVAPGLRILDASFRCDICGELYDAPVTIACGHCFCSTVRGLSIPSPSCVSSSEYFPCPVYQDVSVQ